MPSLLVLIKTPLRTRQHGPTILISNSTANSQLIEPGMEPDEDMDNGFAIKSLVVSTLREKKNVV